MYVQNYSINDTNWWYCLNLINSTSRSQTHVPLYCSQHAEKKGQIWTCECCHAIAASWKYQSRTQSNMELKLYLCIWAIYLLKPALFGTVQASWGQNKVWQRQIKYCSIVHVEQRTVEILWYYFHWFLTWLVFCLFSLRSHYRHRCIEV